MKFSMPVSYALMISIAFRRDIKQNYRQKVSQVILDELVIKLKLELAIDKNNCLIKNHQLIINYFMFKEGNYRGATKDMKETLIKLKHILDELSTRYGVDFNSYIYHNLTDFFKTI